ncbi:hypothetical protein [Plantactinospora sp. BC1]|uniref:hypothetical protein n=1 Tax=Plantactinospora sp. BC1 TaxID=2108470 RepID=UPI0018FE52BB|nr:hypothetical protein [Plantactinospora sp. BC1]
MSSNRTGSFSKAPAPRPGPELATLAGIAPDGWLVLCGYDREPLTLPTQQMVLDRLHVMVNPSGSPHDLRDTLAFSVAHGILPEITPIGLRDANPVLDNMARGNPGKRSVITFDRTSLDRALAWQDRRAGSPCRRDCGLGDEGPDDLRERRDLVA